MELFNQDEINFLAKINGFTKVFNCELEEFPDKVIGYLGEHLKLILEVESKGVRTKLNLFVKCIPRFDKWKAEYIKELTFFKKEYVMLSDLFEEFATSKSSQKWRPKLFLIKEDVFVFEDVTEIGYRMPHHQETMTFEALKATIETLARFHAQSYILEEKKTKELGRPYRIWDDYRDYLQEPVKGRDWRDTGRNAAIDYLKFYSMYKSKPDFVKKIEFVIPKLFDGAIALMKPSSKYRNVVVHRDLWTNNIFLKKQANSYHALFVDFQTVLYCPPMLDLTSLIYFNTTRACRDEFSDEFLDVYYNSLSQELQSVDLNINDIFNLSALKKSYNESILFGITQAALIVPIVAMDSKKREELFYDPETCIKVNVVSRSEEFVEIAKYDNNYKNRVTELLDEIVERYIYSNEDNHSSYTT